MDIFVAGIGTGGTITGVGEVLKKNNPDVKVVGVEPASSPVISEGKSGPHKIQGIGAGFIPDILKTEILDEVITVANEDAFATTKNLAQKKVFWWAFHPVRRFMLQLSSQNALKTREN